MKGISLNTKDISRSGYGGEYAKDGEQKVYRDVSAYEGLFLHFMSIVALTFLIFWCMI